MGAKMMPERLSTLATVAALLLGTIAATLALHASFGRLCDDTVKDALQAVATTGGIISGLSVNGTAILALNGRYREVVLARWSSSVRFVLFGGFFTVVAISLGSALSIVWIDKPWTRWLLAAAVPVYLLVLVSTALLISSAFKWETAPKPITTNERRHPQR